MRRGLLKKRGLLKTPLRGFLKTEIVFMLFIVIHPLQNAFDFIGP